MNSRVAIALIVTILTVALSYGAERLLNARQPLVSGADFIRRARWLVVLIASQGLVLVFDLVILVPAGMGLQAFLVLFVWLVALVSAAVYGLALYSAYRRRAVSKPNN